MQNFSLSITMFGEFSISTENDEVIKKGNRSKKLWLLLAILIINRGRSITQESLIELLWHDIDKCIDPANSLKNLVYRARLLLKDLKQNEKVNFIKFYNGAYMWNNDINCTVDAEEMNNYINKAFYEKDVEKKKIYYNNAINLYRGSFLENIIEEEWIFAKRSYYESMYIKCIINLCEILKGQNQTEDIILLCEQSIIYCPYQEDIHKILIESYIKLNQYTKALAHYENITNSFSHELGVGVSKEIRELYQKIVKNVQGLETDLNVIKRNLIVSRDAKAFFCEFPIFQQIVNFQVNLKYSRAYYDQFEILVLLTIVDKNGEIPDLKKLKNISSAFKNCIIDSLRSNDIISKYSSYQYIIAMMVSDTFEIEKFVNRIKQGINESYENNDIDIIYQYSKLKN